MDIDSGRLLNEQVNQLLDTETLRQVNVTISPDLDARLTELAAAGGWERRESLRIALLYGISASLPAPGSGSPEPAVQVANDLGSRYVALKYQLFKLRSELFREGTRLTATASQNRTFRDLIARLRSGQG